MFQLVDLSAVIDSLDENEIFSEIFSEGRSLFGDEMNFMANTMRKAVEAYTYNYLNEY